MENRMEVKRLRQLLEFFEILIYNKDIATKIPTFNKINLLNEMYDAEWIRKAIIEAQTPERASEWYVNHLRDLEAITYGKRVEDEGNLKILLEAAQFCGIKIRSELSELYYLLITLADKDNFTYPREAIMTMKSLEYMGIDYFALINSIMSKEYYHYFSWGYARDIVLNGVRNNYQIDLTKNGCDQVNIDSSMDQSLRMFVESFLWDKRQCTLASAGYKPDPEAINELCYHPFVILPFELRSYEECAKILKSALTRETIGNHLTIEFSDPNQSFEIIESKGDHFDTIRTNGVILEQSTGDQIDPYHKNFVTGRINIAAAKYVTLAKVEGGKLGLTNLVVSEAWLEKMMNHPITKKVLDQEQFDHIVDIAGNAKTSKSTSVKTLALEF